MRKIKTEETRTKKNRYTNTQKYSCPKGRTCEGCYNYSSCMSNIHSKIF
jgi:hypothetical protein